MVGAIKTMLLTHVKLMKQPEFVLATMSAIKSANNTGDKTPPCLTPARKAKNLETHENHLTQLVDNANQVSSIDISSFGSLLSISLRNNP
jgi:hypothetical protein